ncbi:hypothetical protein PFISCL1PPCAC_17626, partial [Pristionchus fissidentatus]
SIFRMSDPMVLRDAQAGILHACVMMAEKEGGSRQALDTKWRSTNGTSLQSMLTDFKATLQDFAQWYPDKFYSQNGRLMGVKTEETAHIREQMELSVPKNGRGRGGARGGRGGGNRGGYQNTGGSFAARGARGGGFARSAASNAPYSSGFGGGGSSRGGGFGGASSGFGAPSGGGGGGYGRSTRDDDTGFSMSRSTSGFASTYVDFEETTTRGGSEYARSSSNNYDDRSDPFGDRGGGGGGGGYDRGRNDNDDYGRNYSNSRYDDGRDNRRTPDDDWNRRRADDSHYDSYRGGSDTQRHRYDDGRDYDTRGYSRDDDREYRNHDDDRYRDDYNDDYRSHSRDQRQEYGSDSGRRAGGGHYDGYDDGRRARSPDRYDDDRQNDAYSNQHDDRRRDDQETRDEQPRRAFPSAMGGGGGGRIGADEFGRALPYVRAGGGSVFEPVEIRESSSTGQQRGERRNEPEDPYNAKEACLPTSSTMKPPPGFENVAHSMRAPPGLVYAVEAPPGLVRLPRRVTPSERESENDPNEVRIEEVALLVFDTLMQHGGEAIKASDLIGQVLTTCERDLAPVVRHNGGIMHVLDTVSRRNDRMEFLTNELGDDVIVLKEPHREQARRKARENPRKPIDLDIDPEDSASQVSYKSATTSFRAPPAEQSRASVAPVESEIKFADELWQKVRNQGTYYSGEGGYGARMVNIEFRKMNPTQLSKFTSRFPDYFSTHLADSPDQHMLYSIGSTSPSGVRGGGGAPPAAGGSTTSASRGSGRDEMAAAALMRHDREGSLRPRPFSFFHRRNDPEVGWPSHTNYRMRENVTLTAFIDYYEYYVQTEKDKQTVADLQDRLYNDHARLLDSTCDFSQWRTGDVGCYIEPETRTAFRVTVIEVQTEKGKLRVQAADLGWKKPVDHKDMTPLLEKYEGFAYCFPCALEEFEPEDDDELIDMKRWLIKQKEKPIVIEPVAKKSDGTLVASFSFEVYDQVKRYPQELYTRGFASPRHFD